MTSATSRRAVLLGGAAVVLSACSSGSSKHPAASAPPSSSLTTTPTPSPTASPPASPLPTSTPWQPSPNDVQPQVKARAVAIVQALGSWPSGQGGLDAARARLTALGADPALADQAGPLHPTADAVSLQVIDAQYGGILATSASVLVVCAQTTSGPAGATTGTTVDVRLTAASPEWTVTELHPADPGPAVTPPPATASRVLGDSRITVPPAATADLLSGQVHDSVAQALLTLAGTYTIDVSVVRSGHPIDVFGTTRPSDHPLGRAVDVWRINGNAVVDPDTPRSLVEGFMRDAATIGSYNVGGPYLLSGGKTANQFFSDPTHHDHVHMGFLT